MWSKKDKILDNTLVRLANAINDKNGSKIVNPENSTYYTTDIPFFAGFKLQTFIDLSFTPYFQQLLLDNGKDIFLLDGSQTPFMAANTISSIVLTNNSVVSYIKLVLGNTYIEGKILRLVESIDDVEFRGEPSPEQYEKLRIAIKFPSIAKDKDTFIVKSSFLENENVIEITTRVSLDGRVEILDRKTILENMPVRIIELEF